MTKSKNKKRSVFTYKNFNNILMSSSIFNTLKKFREKKQVSRYFDLSSFDLSTLDQIKNNINSNDFGENKVIKYMNWLLLEKYFADRIVFFCFSNINRSKEKISHCNS